jgi:hypothetical protein
MRKAMLVAAIALVLGSTVMASDNARDWPYFEGPQHTSSIIWARYFGNSTHLRVVRSNSRKLCSVFSIWVSLTTLQR